MALLLRADNLSKSIGPRLLFAGISISLDDRERTGLIGANGSGKSTLLKILAGQQPPDSGLLTSRRQLRVGYLAQDPTFEPGITVMDAAVSKRGETFEQETHAQILLDQMGFIDLNQEAQTLSGGWKKRLAIASAMLAEPDLLLLDEPTNHLDLEGIEWLEEMLADATFAFVVVSHDRVFLENTCTRTVELSPAFPDGYLSTAGAYGAHLEHREQFLAAQQGREQALASRVRREIEWLRRGAKARTTKAKGRIEDAGKLMQDLADTKRRNAAGVNKSAGIDFNATGRQTRKLIEARHIGKRLGDRQILTDVDFIVAPTQCLGILGQNGSGKTTLIRILTQQLAPDTGEIVAADGLRIALYEQSREKLDKSLTLRRALSPGGDVVVYRGQSMHVSGWARKFLFRPDQLDLPVSELSGGEQARILIADLMLSPADLLILDEPTNDLDIPSLEVLEESLADFPGGIILVTHDRYLLERLSSQLLALRPGAPARMFADLLQWQANRDAEEAAKTQQRKSANLVSSAASASTGGTPTSGGAATATKPKALSAMEERDLDKIEGQIAQAEQDLHEAQAQMSDPAILRDRARMAALIATVGQKQKQIESMYKRWETLESRRAGR